MKKDLTTEQKVKLVMGADFWTNYDAEGALYRFVVSDGPVGLRQPRDLSDPFADLGYIACL